jgi:colanic acid/amylovoran biosynthesis glycosyltransferase
MPASNPSRHPNAGPESKAGDEGASLTPLPFEALIVVDSKTLAVLPALPVRVTPSGQVAITRKFIDGMRKYVEEWGGPVSAFMEPTNAGTSNLDEVEVDPADLPFKLEVTSFVDSGLGRKLNGHAVALCSLDYRQTHLAKLCRSIGVPCVYVSEYSLKTRLQVIRAEVANPIVSLRQLREYPREWVFRDSVRTASGIQCNGSPTFEDYRRINSNPFLYFDTRVSEEMLITPDELEKRGEVLKQGGPLRLLFSGRLIAMKGADHLVRVAAGLKELGVPFRMTICGDGTQAPSMKAEIERLGLGDVVEMAGVLNFQDELVPLTKHRSDLFVCCHRSGDPSCTYLEVMSCGVPIVGYDNEAFVGVVKESGAGWLSPMNRPEQLAARIASLAKDRPSLLKAARDAADFGRRNTFDRTFKARIEHMKSCVRPSLAAPVAT